MIGGSGGGAGSPESSAPWRRVTGEGQGGALGLGFGRGLAGEHRPGMGSALGCLGRRCRAGGMALDGEAALSAGNSPE